MYLADEAFLTGTPFCILPTTSFNGKEIGNGKMGKITQNLLDKWSQNVDLDIMAQIRSYYVKPEKNNIKQAPSPYQFKG